MPDLLRVDPRLREFVFYALRTHPSVRFTSGFRTRAEQSRLFARRRRNPRGLPAAPPGRSKHERGLAVDLAGSFADLRMLASAGTVLGIQWGGPIDPVHFELR